MVSHHDHHRHSAYLLAHVPMRRASRRASSAASASWCSASAAGCARSRPQLASETFAWQVLCLRLGVIKCHARGEVRADALALHRDGTQARLDFSADWAAAHPRTLYLLQEEVLAWARGGVLKLSLCR